MNLGRFKSDKRKIGVFSFILIVLLGVALTFGIGNPPPWLIAILTPIVMMWIGVEGYNDSKVPTATSESTVHVDTIDPAAPAPNQNLEEQTPVVVADPY